MLDDLKKDRQVGFGAQERIKLALYVAGLLALGGAIVIGPKCQTLGRKPAQPETTAPAEVEADLGPLLDPAEVARLAAEDGGEPDAWSHQALEHVLAVRRKGRLGPVVRRLDPAGLRGQDLAQARGRVFEVVGKVTDVAVESWMPRPTASGSDRLWTVILEGADGKPVIAVKYGLASDRGEGLPHDYKPAGVPAEAIVPGQHVIARGVYVQQRRGSFGETAVLEPAPVLLTVRFRVIEPPERQERVISGLDEALWEDIKDRTNSQTRKWDEDALFEVLQWARARGQEQVREDILHGDLGWTRWERARFDAWKEEVQADLDAPRPLTDGSRGKVFRFSGVLGEVIDLGWDQIPRNRFHVDRFQKISLLADHYRGISLVLFLPWPIESFPDVTRASGQDLRLYGVFVKNFTYDTRFTRPDGSGRVQPATVPMFVVLHVEPYPEDEAGAHLRGAMLWVAGAMVLFGLLFYIVLIRGGARQTKRMEAHRMALRKRIRAKGQGARLPQDRSEIPPEDGA